MLKIKDNVDLKELEKYGFIKTQPYAYTNYWQYHFRVDSVSEITIDNSREIRIEIDESTSLNSDILYDLIQAGMVEKVGVRDNE